MFIYSLTNKVNGKQYIGQTTRSVEWRWNQHRKHRTSVNFPVYYALRKYGVDSFTVETLATGCSVECLNYLEPLFIAACNSLVPHGYNLDGGGKNNTVHPDTAARMSTGKKGKPKSAEHRAKIGAAHRGRKIPIEQRARLSSAKRGREISVEEYLEIYKAKHSRKPKRTHCKKGHALTELDRAIKRCGTCNLKYQKNYDATVRPRTQSSRLT